MQALTELLLNWIPHSLSKVKTRSSPLQANYTFTRSFRVILNAMLLFMYIQEYIKHPELSLKRQSIEH